MQWKKGFTMVELMVVLIILGILVAVAAPMYFANTNRAKASEAVAAVGVIRQSIRDYKLAHPSYTYPTFLASNDPAAGIIAPFTTGVGVDVGVAQYFSNGAYSVSTAALSAAPFDGVNALNFVITADGSATSNTLCSAIAGTTPSNCALKSGDVAGIQVKMDNSGTIYARYTATGAWEKY